MKSVPHSIAQVLAVGFIVLLFMSLLLFWTRFLCETLLSERMPGEAQGIGIQPSGLVPPELEEDPNVVYPSFVGADLNHHSIMHMGVIDYLTTRFHEGRRSNIYFIKSDKEYMYLDKKSGQIVYRDIHSQIMPDKSAQLRLVPLYVGPEGISEIPNQTLGRFVDPIIDRSQLFRKGDTLRELILYDKNLRCFFRIDFDQKTIAKGPEFGNTGPLQKPIQIGWLWKNEFSTRINWKPPQIQDSNENDNEPDFRGRRPIIPSSGHIDADPYLLVLDESGRIDLIDKQTLEFAGTAGRLPGPETYFGKKPSVAPKDLPGYIVQPLVLNKFYRDDGKMFKRTFGYLDDSERRIASRIDREYLGMFATGVSRSGTAMALAVFNAEGQRIKSGYTRLPLNGGRYTSYLESSKAVFWKTPWAPALTIGKFLAENLHPPILSLASYFTASAFEAGAGHRALFLLPNSFVAMIGRDGPGNRAERYAAALWWMMPSIILALWLASRVGKDATITGFSQKARRRWIAGTIAFGLPAYITYRLTKPKITLVTCANCGKPRRPDMDTCHRCDSPWHVPELTPPNWRVLDSPVQTHHDSSIETNAME